MQLLFLLILKLISHVNTLINIAKAVAKPTIVLYQVMMALLLWRASSLPLQDNNNNTEKSTYKNDVYILKLKNLEIIIIIIISQTFITRTKSNQMNDQRILVAVIFYLLNKSAVMSFQLSFNNYYIYTSILFSTYGKVWKRYCSSYLVCLIVKAFNILYTHRRTDLLLFQLILKQICPLSINASPLYVTVSNESIIFSMVGK